MKKLSTDIEKAWYDYFMVKYHPFLTVHKNVKISSIIGDKKYIEWIWKEWKTWKNIKELYYFRAGGVRASKIENIFYSGEIDLVAETKDSEPVFFCEINGAGHDDKNDMAKFLLFMAVGINLWFIKSFPDACYDWGYLAKHRRYLKKETYKEKRARKISLLNDIAQVKRQRAEQPQFVRRKFLEQNSMKKINPELFYKLTCLEMKAFTWESKRYQDEHIEKLMKKHYSDKYNKTTSQTVMH